MEQRIIVIYLAKFHLKEKEIVHPMKYAYTFLILLYISNVLHSLDLRKRARVISLRNFMRNPRELESFHGAHSCYLQGRVK